MSKEPQKTLNENSGPSWNDLGPRLISAMFLIPIFVAAIVIGQLAVALLIGAVLAVAYHEWSLMTGGGKVSRFSYFIMGMLALSSIAYPAVGFWVSLGLFIFTGILAMLLNDRIGKWPTNGIAAGFLGFSGLCVLALRGDTNLGILAAVYLTAVIWLTDSGAFFVGRQLGGKKLAPIISPSKTWSGAVGGLVFGTLGGTLVWGFGTLSPLWIGILISAAISASAQIGDLAESALKRHFLIKDSGDIIPGHGGVLDRIDSFTVGAVLLYFIGVAHFTSDHVAEGVLLW
ncbi:phosphatidate cytidylyltransferase [Maritalea sp.]|uniref:phosphatidate cytidylyltransferase n=1 Tax=Maritalea sp. TaxID=2003361 RepID=UPI003EF23EB4